MIFFSRSANDRILHLLQTEPQNTQPQKVEGKQAFTDPNLRHSEVIIRQSHREGERPREPCAMRVRMQREETTVPEDQGKPLIKVKASSAGRIPGSQSGGRKRAVLR